VLWCVLFMGAGGVFGEEERRKHTGRCIDCGEDLELYMLDLKKGRRVLQCNRCGLYHFYKKDMLGKWKVVKASKIPDLWR
jgi:DNA-directed RNA polymerase subunit RPC12/RpoP